MDIDIISIISQCITYPLFIICMSLAIYGDITLWKLRKAMFIRKREPKLYFGLNITLITSLFLLLVSYIATTYSDSALAYAAPRLLLYIIMYIFLFFCVTKSFLIYFRQKWTFYTLELEWQQIINDTALRNNWFISNNYKYGNVSYIYKIFGIYHIIGMLIVFIFTAGLYKGLIPIQITFLVIVIPVLLDACFYAILVCKQKRLALNDDIFFIHWEQVRHSRIMLIFMIIYIMFLISTTITGDTRFTNSFFTPAAMIIFYSIHHVSTYSILKENLFDNREPEISVSSASALQSLQSQSPSNSCLSNQVDTSDVVANKKEKKLTLKRTLKSKEAIHSFLVHLSKEYSMECLLSFVEFTQFIAYAFENCELVSEKMSISDFRLITFPSNIPLCSIIENVEKENSKNNKDIERDLKIMAHRMHEKYIKVDSELEINLKFDQRKVCKNTLADLTFLLENKGINVCDVVNVLGMVKEEMYILLTYSFARFKDTDDYKSVFGSNVKVNIETINEKNA